MHIFSPLSHMHFSFLPLCTDHLRSHYRGLKNDVWSRGSIDSHFFLFLLTKSLTTEATFRLLFPSVVRHKVKQQMASSHLRLHSTTQRKGKKGSNGIESTCGYCQNVPVLPFFLARPSSRKWKLPAKGS